MYLGICKRAEEGLLKLRYSLYLTPSPRPFFPPRGQCKEHDLAMINQLLDDPKLTARKYREWKEVNTLLVQDIYEQQRRAPTSAQEDTPEGLKKPPSARVENSI